MAQSQRSKKTGDSGFPGNLADMARSVLIQYGISGTVGGVTPGDCDNHWHIRVDRSYEGPLTLRVRCSEGTPVHVIRNAIAWQLDA
jgi:hypothetical protein